MNESFFIVFVLPVVALVLILGWFILLVRGGRAAHLSLKGFGVAIQFDSESPQPRKVINELH